MSSSWPMRSPLVLLLSLGIVATKVLWPVYVSSASTLRLLWPGKQVIASVLHVRGDLTSDFLASSTSDSAYLISAKLISAILPQGRDEMLAAYASYSCLLSILVLWLSIIFLMKSWHVLCQKNHLLSPGAIESIAPLGYIGLSFVLPEIYHREIEGLWRIIHPARVAGWDFPLADALFPSGISFLLTLTALLARASLGAEHQGFRLNPAGLARVAVPMVLIFLATLVHPVVPLFGVAVLLFFSLAVEKFIDLRYVKDAGLFALAWLSGALMVLYLFPQAGIDPSEYYRIYVVNRHPHHYLPSRYIPTAQKDVLINFVVLGVLAIISSRCTKSLWSLKAFALCFGFLGAVHGAQYLLVEVLKSPTFITLGISRVSGVYNFLFLLLLVTSLSVVGYRVKTFLFRRVEGSTATATATVAVPRRRAIGLALSGAVLCTLVIASIFLLSKIYHNQYKLIAKQPERAIRAKFDSLVTARDYEVIADFRLANLREVGGLAVYSDKYFPFASQNILEWESRRVLNRAFLQCFKRKKNVDGCATRFAKRGGLYVLTKVKISGKKAVFQVRTTKGLIYAYQV